MELRLEIKLASVEELAGVAKALNGLHVGEVKQTREPYGKPAKVELTTETQTEDEYIEVESPFSATAGQPVKEEPKTEAKPANKKQTAAEAKAAKKAAEEAERAERVARLKASMEANKEIADAALAKSAEARNTPALTPEEPVEAIVNEIKLLGDKLMAFTGMPIESKQALTAQVMAKVGVPQGVRPTQLQQPMLGQFRDLYRSSVEATVNPVMGGLV